MHKREKKNNTYVVMQGDTHEFERRECLRGSMRLLSKCWPGMFVFLHRNRQQRDFIWVSVMTAVMLVVSFCEALLF